MWPNCFDWMVAKPFLVISEENVLDEGRTPEILIFRVLWITIPLIESEKFSSGANPTHGSRAISQHSLVYRDTAETCTGLPSLEKYYVIYE